MDAQFDPRAAMAGGVLAQQVGAGQFAAPNQAKLNISRTASAASRLHDLLDTLEKLVGGAHEHINRVAGAVPTPAPPQQYGNGAAAATAGSQMERLEQGLTRFKILLKNEAAHLYQRLSEL